MINPIEWKDDSLFLIDQRKLPLIDDFIKVSSLEECHLAIRDMVVRGAPCIGITAIFGLALWAQSKKDFTFADFDQAGTFLITARPTAVNLENEVNTCKNYVNKLLSEDSSHLVAAKLIELGLETKENIKNDNLIMAKLAERELQKIYGDRPLKLMTHCNTGTLACGDLGTALGVISYLAQKDKIEQVWVDETRPYMQGTRLTSYELVQQNIPHSIVVEGAASYLMREKLVDAIFVGADRITLNGDTANKIGTSTLAIVAKYYKIPFFVVAPTSSFDLNTTDGTGIEIELRDPLEILSFRGKRVAPETATALNPSFDVTRYDLINRIICEKGSIDPATSEMLERVVRK